MTRGEGHGSHAGWKRGCQCGPCQDFPVKARERKARWRAEQRGMPVTPPDSNYHELLARLRLGAADRSWVSEAACRGLGPDVFFPQHGENATKAKAVCGACGVSEECLEWALVTGQRHGVWGGRSENDRIEIRAGRA